MANLSIDIVRRLIGCNPPTALKSPPPPHRCVCKSCPRCLHFANFNASWKLPACRLPVSQLNLDVSRFAKMAADRRWRHDSTYIYISFPEPLLFNAMFCIEMKYIHSRSFELISEEASMTNRDNERPPPSSSDEIVETGQE